MKAHAVKVAAAESPGVTGRVTTRRRFVGRAAREEDDALAWVALTLPEFAPWELRFDFLRCFEVDDDDRTKRRITIEFVGYRLERPLTIAEANEALASEHGVRLTADRLGLLHEYFWSYQRIAHLQAELDDDAAWDHRKKVTEAIRGETPLYRDLPLLVHMYREYAHEADTIYALADLFHCHRKTIWLQLTKACEAGLITESELPPRRKRLDQQAARTRPS